MCIVVACGFVQLTFNIKLTSDLMTRQGHRTLPNVVMTPACCVVQTERNQLFSSGRILTVCTRAVDAGMSEMGN